MGCSQSDEANDPSKNPNLPHHSPGAMYQSGVHSPENFAITIIGNTSVQGLVLGFSGKEF